jgi:hypothetical protein
LLDAALSASVSTSLGHGRTGYFFGATDEHTLYEIGKAIAEGLVEQGKSKSPEPTTFTKEEIDKYFQGSNYMGSNSRCRATKGKKEMLNSIKREIEEELKK